MSSRVNAGALDALGAQPLPDGAVRILPPSIHPSEQMPPNSGELLIGNVSS